MTPLSPMQAHALGVLVDHGTCDAAELSRMLLIDGRSIGPVLGGLERRGLIERTYTEYGHRHGSTPHAYYATNEGHAAYRAEFGEDE